MSKLISVIVPVYNVDRYLLDCVESILGQDYTNLQIILIDDGSTDCSGAICDEYSKRDARIQVIHQKNGGAAAAKNAGLKVATGEYLSFVDSDDLLAPGAYSHMVKILESSGADVVQCSYLDLFKNHSKEQIQTLAEMSGEEYLVQFTKDWTCALLWDKLYRRNLFDGIFFETGHKIDDEYFTYCGIMNAQKVVRDGRIIYNYRKRASSVMLSPESANRILFDKIDYLTKRRIIVGKRFSGLRRVYDRHYVDLLIYLSRDPCITEEHIQEIRRCLKRYFGEKGHTEVDYHLIPALLKLWVRSPKAILQDKRMPMPIDNTQYFD